ncbi:type II and III secretion system protein [Ascidiimonas aurantiaca]|uniref:type II secretion system protein GspD n=1 Tax=Ascidiimonas aurantiaca TaxID=1685432 RepID=UPI0030EB7B4E
MIRKITLLLACTACFILNAQEANRIESIRNQLEALSVESKGLTENLKVNIDVRDVTLSNFLIAVSQVHKVNLNVAPELNQIKLVNNFSEVTVADLLVFLCKEYELDINFTGNILSIYKYQPPAEVPEKREIPVVYDALNNRISFDIKADRLYDAFRAIMDATGQNMVFSPQIENERITSYIKSASFEEAMQMMALTNNLTYQKSKDGFHLFDREFTAAGIEGQPAGTGRIPITRRIPDFHYRILDTVNKILEVNFVDIPIKDIIYTIGNDLSLNIFTARSLDGAGNATFKTRYISFDALLDKIFESGQQVAETPQNGNIPQGAQSGFQNTAPSRQNFTYKKEGNTYFFGTADQLSVRKIEIIRLMHRSVELLGDPQGNAGSTRSAGRTAQAGAPFFAGAGQNTSFQGGQGFNNPMQPRNTNLVQQNQNQGGSGAIGSLTDILPEEILGSLDIKTDIELNSFFVSGPAAEVNRFKAFLKQIDEPIPYILIEVMLLEINRSATVETGISWGIGEEPTQTQGGIFPEADITLGAKTINRVIGGFDGFVNIGKVVPEFYANIKAMEANGNIKIRSTPKLSTLNGHRATLSIGETTYYVLTQQNFFGAQIPQTSEFRNYVPIDAELAISIRPLVSGDGQITLDVNVIQSDFNGERIDSEAPPGLNSREFSSIIRVRDQDMVVLGGLEEKVRNDSGRGVPFLSRIPVIKWFFSRRVREDSRKKLTVLIKPTVFY